jgi:hypothetical protein
VRLRLRVEHELRERAVQPRHRAAQEGEARTAELRPGVEVQPERPTEVDMVLRRELERPRRAPAPIGTLSCGRLGTAISISDRSAWIASSRSAELFSPSAMPATCAISSPLSWPFDFSWPICLDSLLRCACSSSVRVWIALRSASSDWKRGTSRKACGVVRASRRATTCAKSLRSRVMSSMGSRTPAGALRRSVSPGL